MSKILRSLTAIFVCVLPASGSSSVPGIHNFHKVNDHLYRGAQPTPEGLKYLAKLGVKTVLDLRLPGERGAGEAQVVRALGMRYVNIPMSGFAPPTKAEITRILALLQDTKSGAVFVHCKRGADRTGAVIAAYRIDHDRWDNTRALKEARNCGMAFYELPRRSFIHHFHAIDVTAQSASGDGGQSSRAETVQSATPALANQP